jgi:hypothetical protein
VNAFEGIVLSVKEVDPSDNTQCGAGIWVHLECAIQVCCGSIDILTRDSKSCPQNQGRDMVSIHEERLFNKLDRIGRTLDIGGAGESDQGEGVASLAGEDFAEGRSRFRQVVALEEESAELEIRVEVLRVPGERLVVGAKCVRIESRVENPEIPHGCGYGQKLSAVEVGRGVVHVDEGVEECKRLLLPSAV